MFVEEIEEIILANLKVVENNDVVYVVRTVGYIPLFTFVFKSLNYTIFKKIYSALEGPSYGCHVNQLEENDEDFNMGTFDTPSSLIHKIAVTFI